MKRLSVFLFFLSFASLSWGQSKKSLRNDIERYENRIEEMQIELESWKSRSRQNDSSYDEILEANTDLMTSNAELTSSNAELVRQLRNEKQRSKKAEFKVDSLQQIVNALRFDSSFIINPENEKDSIIKVVQTYFAAKIWEDRLDYVLVPKKVEPFMARFYSPYMGGQIIRTQDVEVNDENIKDRQVFKVKVGNSIHIMKKVDGEFKIDWAASNGLNSISPKDFKERDYADPLTFRVIAELNNKYPQAYKKRKDTHWSIELKTINPSETFTGFVLKDSEAGQAIYELLKEGKKEIMIKMKKEAGDKTGNITEITDLISNSWSVD